MGGAGTALSLVIWRSRGSWGVLGCLSVSLVACGLTELRRSRLDNQKTKWQTIHRRTFLGVAITSYEVVEGFFCG